MPISMNHNFRPRTALLSRCGFAALLVGGLLLAATATPVMAGPPAYLLLRRPESPGSHNSKGRPDAATCDVRASGYAYGWFGTAPRYHASRQFGYYRNYCQWTTY